MGMTEPAAPPPDTQDLGFGRVAVQQQRARLLNRDGSTNSRKYGIKGRRAQQLYMQSLNAPWPRFLLWALGGILLINGIFALAYTALGDGALAGGESLGVGDPFLSALFFSLARFTLTGTGTMHPVGIPANWLAAFEALLGVLVLVVTGAIIVARLTRPRAEIHFSESAVIAPYRGGRALMFRMINVRPSELLNVQVRLNLAWTEQVDGAPVRKFHQLALERNTVEFFTMQWVVVHPITADSPLARLTPERLRQSEAEFFVLITALEETFSTTVNARTSYRYDEVRWDAKFADMFVPSLDGIVTVDVDRLHRLDRLPEGATQVPSAAEDPVGAG